MNLDKYQVGINGYDDEDDDDLTSKIQDGTPQCILLADNVLLIGETRIHLDNKLQQQRKGILETSNFNISKASIEHMKYNFEDRIHEVQFLSGWEYGQTVQNW